MKKLFKLLPLVFFLFTTVYGFGQLKYEDYYLRETTYNGITLPLIEEHNRIIFNSSTAFVYNVTAAKLSKIFYYVKTIKTEEFTWYVYEDFMSNLLFIEIHGNYTAIYEEYVKHADKEHVQDWLIKTVLFKD